MAAKKPQQSLQALLHDLTSPDYRVRRNAARDLGYLGDRGALDALVVALKDKTVTVRSRAIVALRRIADPRAIEPLVHQITDPRCHIHRPAYEALLSFGAAALPALLQALQDSNAKLRAVAAHALGELRDPRAVEPLLQVLDDPVPHVRKNTTIALRLLKDRRAVEPLIIRLDDPDPDICILAAFALGDLGDRRAIVPLESLLAKPYQSATTYEMVTRSLQRLRTYLEQQA
jgi:HEAT repeat protein